MINVEETIARVWETVGRLDHEIETTIQKLCGQNILEPVELFPIAGHSKTVQQPEKKLLETSQFRSKPGPKCSKIGGLLSSKKVKRVESESSMDIDIEEEDSVTSKSFALKTTGRSKSSDTFSAIESETFLTSVMDKWVFGATFINSSNTAQQLPIVILNLLGEENVESKTFSYEYKTGLLNLDGGSVMGNSQILPVQEALQGDPLVVRPGCKFYVTASFNQPILTDYDLPISMLISLLCDSNQVWSKCLPLNALNSIGFDNDLPMSQFLERILVELSEYSQKFSVHNLHSHIYPFNEFLTKKLGLTTIRTVQTRFDTKTDYFATRQLNSLWGLLVQVETCDRASDHLRGVVYSRSTQQLDCFRKFLSAWGDQQLGANPTLKIDFNQEAHNPARITKAVQDEIKTVIHFICMQEQSAFQRKNTPCTSDSSPAQSVISKWFLNYMQHMNATDEKFM